jgi:segregation and condensation protein B
MTKDELMPIIDALIFASDTPLSIQKIKQLIDEDAADGLTLKEIRQAIDDINQDNKIQRRGFFLQEVAGGYQFRTRPNYASWVKKLKKTRPFRLTQPTLETLAIIAYRQPIIRAEIEKIRGVDSGGVIKALLERGLIKIVGRKNIAGRPFLLGSTSRFLEVFGLEKLSDMPSLKEFERLDDGQLPTLLREKIGEEFPLVDETEAEALEMVQTATDDELLLAAQSGAEEIGETVPDDVIAPGDEVLNDAAGQGNDVGRPAGPEEDQSR